eukprot:727966-Prymnesium_polylepis.2
MPHTLTHTETVEPDTAAFPVLNTQWDHNTHSLCPETAQTRPSGSRTSKGRWLRVQRAAMPAAGRALTRPFG